jgi:hypothetical protein
VSKFRIEVGEATEEQKARRELPINIVIDEPSLLEVLWFVEDHAYDCTCEHCAWLLLTLHPDMGPEQ